MSSLIRLVSIASVLFLVASCGGGGSGGSGSTTLPTVNTPAPTVSVSLSAAKTSVGKSVTLTWSSTNTSSCTGSDSASGTKPVSGTETITPTMSGQFRYTISCDGAGGSTKQTTVLFVPMPVFPTSYENKNSINLDDRTIPPLSEITNISAEVGEQGFNQRIAFGDFFQDGSYGAVALSTIYKNVFPAGSNPTKGVDSPSKIYFLKRDSTGKWSDGTSLLIKDGNRYTCIMPTFIEVADLNNDGKPDVVIACTGVDFDIILPAGTDMRPYWLAKQFAVLSQTDDTYKLVEIPTTNPVTGSGIYAHQAAVADVNGDGKADILYVDPNGNETPFIMWGNGDGTFRQDMTRFPTELLHKTIFSIRAIPVNGKLNVIVSGRNFDVDPLTNNHAYGTKVLQYTNGAFQTVATLTPAIPLVAATGKKYDFALDWIYKNGYYYAYFIDRMYDNHLILKIDPVTQTGVVLEEHTSQKGFAAGSGDIFLTSTNYFVNQLAGCGISSKKATDWFYYACSFRTPLK